MRIRWIKKERKERGGEGKEEEEINSRGKTRIELGSTRLGGVFKLASGSDEINFLPRFERFE